MEMASKITMRVFPNVAAASIHISIFHRHNLHTFFDAVCNNHKRDNDFDFPGASTTV